MNGQEGNFGKLNMFCFLSISSRSAPFAQGVDFFHIFFEGAKQRFTFTIPLESVKRVKRVKQFEP